jgi:F420H(2)-dependent quinone reductase
MSTKRERAPRVPPRWFIRAAWVVHRGMYRASGGRFGLRRARPDRWGMLSLTTTGRRTGRTHRVIIGYIEDGQNLVTMAMNGWGEGEPAWWLNLQASPDTRVKLTDGQRDVRARAAQGAERARLWAAWRQIDPNLDAYAERRSSETAIVVLEPRVSDVVE